VSEPAAGTFVLDASAVLALFYDEPGADEVNRFLSYNCIISTINLAEVMQKLRQNNTPAEAAAAPGTLIALGVEIVETFSASAAARSAELWDNAHHVGLSLGDRCCLALTVETPDGIAVTADKAWREISELSPFGAGVQLSVACIR
jgi:PIN domain nuclease of toxin-antitoxin system